MSEIEGFEDLIPGIEPSEDPNEIIDSEVFQKLQIGDERVCVILRSDGFTYKTIAVIMGISESKVRAVMYTVRQRFDIPAR